MKKVELDKELIGARIQQIRLNNDLSEKEFAKQLGAVSVYSVRKWERGDTTPSLENFIKICNCFDTCLGDLIDLYRR